MTNDELNGVWNRILVGACRRVRHSSFVIRHFIPVPSAVALLALIAPVSAQSLEGLRYNNPGLVVDLSVGLWAFPLPMDWDGDGDLDLLVGCPDKPTNGVWFFENAAGKDAKFPVLKAGRRLGPAQQHLRLSWTGGTPRLLAGNKEFPNFTKGDFSKTTLVFPKDRVAPIKNLRGNSWQFADFDGDGKYDLLVGHDVWDDFGWFTTNDWWKGYDAQGRWTRGPLRGWVYWLRNEGTNDKPRYAAAQQILADGKPLETYGWPFPCLADFDGDGDLDLVCGEFLDGLTYFENIGTRTNPRYAAGRRLPFTMDLQMIVPTAVDWNGDGKPDLIVGDEDGRVAFIENKGHGEFAPPRYIQQEADELDAGALATPVGVDWDGDGDEDIICGCSAGYILFFENLSGPGVASPKWAAPRRLEADGKVIRIMAGPNGSIQGPAEAKWGYTTLSVADWDGDGLPDLIVNSIWGRVQWYRNIGTRKAPKLAAAQPIEVAWPGEPRKPEWNWWKPKPRELVTQWRTTPFAIDLDRDGRCDLVMLDHEGWLAFFKRRADGSLEPGQRVLCDENGAPLRLNGDSGGRSGRRKFTMTDWDGDGVIDLLLNGRNAEFWRGLGRLDGKWLFKKMGDVSERNIQGHDTSPTTVDFDGDGIRDLLIGAEDGRLYFLKNPRAK